MQLSQLDGSSLRHQCSKAFQENAFLNTYKNAYSETPERKAWVRAQDYYMQYLDSKLEVDAEPSSSQALKDIAALVDKKGASKIIRTIKHLVDAETTRYAYPEMRSLDITDLRQHCDRVIGSNSVLNDFKDAPIDDPKHQAWEYLQELYLRYRDFKLSRFKASNLMGDQEDIRSDIRSLVTEEDTLTLVRTMMHSVDKTLDPILQPETRGMKK